MTDNLVQPCDLTQDCREAEEYDFTICLTPKDADMLRQYAQRIGYSEAALIQRFINDLVKGKFCTNDEVAQKANKWYEGMNYWRVLNLQIDRKPVKIVRFTDGGKLATHGTIFEIREQMEKRFPGRDIKYIV